MKKLNVFLFGLLFFSIVNTSCVKNTDDYIKSTVFLNIASWNLPDTSRVSSPFNLVLNSYITNSCTRDMEFVITRTGDTNFKVHAQATYENSGESCTTIQVYSDSTIVITPEVVGKYYYTFLQEDDFTITDSIVIIP